MTYSEYLEYLQSSAWRLITAKVCASADWRCEVCNSEADDLQVHHLTYAHLGDESLLELMALCGRCHAAGHFRPYVPNAAQQLAFEFQGAAFVSRRGVPLTFASGVTGRRMPDRPIAFWQLARKHSAKRANV